MATANDTSTALDRADRVSELLIKSTAIADLIGHVDHKALCDTTLSNAAWALEDMLNEAHGILVMEKIV